MLQLVSVTSTDGKDQTRKHGDTNDNYEKVNVKVAQDDDLDGMENSAYVELDGEKSKEVRVCICIVFVFWLSQYVSLPVLFTHLRG